MGQVATHVGIQISAYSTGPTSLKPSLQLQPSSLNPQSFTWGTNERLLCIAHMCVLFKTILTRNSYENNISFLTQKLFSIYIFCFS